MKVSVITVCYHNAGTLADTIESVLSQTYSDIEYVIVDGGSTDGTVEIIRHYEPRFSGRLKWVSEPDGGMYDAMNKGIRMATGDVVGILNADDFFSDNRVVERIVQALADKSVDAVYGDVRFVGPDDLHKTVRYYSSRVFTPALFRFGFMPAHPSFYTYKRNYERFGLYRTDYRIAADYELLIRFLYKERLSARYLSFDLVTMRTGGESTRSWRSNLLLNREIVRACRENGIYTNLPLLFFKYIYKVKELFVFRS